MDNAAATMLATAKGGTVVATLALTVESPGPQIVVSTPAVVGHREGLALLALAAVAVASAVALAVDFAEAVHAVVEPWWAHPCTL